VAGGVISEGGCCSYPRIALPTARLSGTCGWQFVGKTIAKGAEKKGYAKTALTTRVGAVCVIGIVMLPRRRTDFLGAI